TSFISNPDTTCRGKSPLSVVQPTRSKTIGSPTITTLSDLVLRSHDDYETVFEHVAAHLQAEDGTIKKADRAKGELEASWKYGVNPFGQRVTVHFSSPEEGIVELSLTGSFV